MRKPQFWISTLLTSKAVICCSSPHFHQKNSLNIVFFRYHIYGPVCDLHAFARPSFLIGSILGRRRASKRLKRSA